ncbi:MULTISPECIES: response regulator transcription factor [Bacillus]|uniref:Response regulator transcription factor n=1 Tax=Bacillus glycinifermentans TaxID=1664069 RepID=A0AAJ3Z3J0_9BACI|nr:MULTISPECIES: response regulator transcription factor [Bacillus]KKB75178.1 transcriptional regulator [Bacillus sp. TH008]MDU0071623.1 response regulator transcription factor [Bacillus sp. IG6]MED8020031.1 response regulator transcription factor [Bacillus glycinifermentans]NUJ17602.1 response regulator transcription factor [Bacillus glycinifermentans]QAT67537.1 response regulator transcription factor [Bacillus glycinifermentans]
MTKIMIVEDSEDIRQLLQNYLEKYGYNTVTTHDFTTILDTFLEEKPDLVLLDINLPAYDGYYWCRQIRQHSTCPIIFISARSGEMDQVMAIENGGDDYIEKPFSYEVVLAKIKSQIRRAFGEYAVKQGEKVVEFEGVQLFVERFELRFRDKKHELSKKESRLLEVLLERGEKVTSRDRLMEKTWETDTFVDENTLNVYIARLRKKLRGMDVPFSIESVRGEGYQLRARS